jgi:hypothetical protein
MFHHIKSHVSISSWVICASDIQQSHLFASNPVKSLSIIAEFLVGEICTQLMFKPQQRCCSWQHHLTSV